MFIIRRVTLHFSDVFQRAARGDGEDKERILFVFFFFFQNHKVLLYSWVYTKKVDTNSFDWCITLICVTKINRVFLVSFALILKKLSWYRRRYGRLQWVKRWGTKREEFTKELRRKQERREQTRQYLMILMNYYMTALKTLMGVAHDIPAIKAAVKWRYEDPMPCDISGGDHPRHAKTFRAGHRMTSAPRMGHAHYVTNTGHTSAANRARVWSISSGTSAKGMKTNPPIHPPPTPALLSTL